MAWEENKHPRDENGQFTSKGNESSGGGNKVDNLSLEDIKNYYENNVFGFNVEIQDGRLVGYDAEGEEIDWDLEEARYNIGEFMKDNEDFDSDNDFESWEPEDETMQEYANRLDKMGLSQKDKEYYLKEIQRVQNGKSEYFDNMSQLWDAASDSTTDDFDNSQRADYIVENYGDLELTDNEFDQIEYILGDRKKAEEFKNIVKDNLDLGDGEYEAIRNALENFKEEQKSESIDFDNDPFFQELYGSEAKQRKNKEKTLDETTKKVESLLSEGKGKEFLEVLNNLSEEDSFEVLKRIRNKK